MGNGITKLGSCCAAAGEISRRHDIAVKLSDPLDEGLGHSFCYVRPDPYRFSSSSKVYSEDDAAAAHTTPFFRSISGASVSANTSTPLSTAPIDSCPYSSTTLDPAAAFESSTCFASIPLQPVPRRSFHSGSGNLGGGVPERGFLSGPIERGIASGPIDRGLYSCPMEKGFESSSFSHGDEAEKIGLLRVLRRAIRSKIGGGYKSNRGAVPVKGSDGDVALSSSVNLSSHVSLDDEDDCSMQSQNLEWAQGKAGEDRMQVAISEEHGWVFVGIYDGFNGPDAPDYLLSNLYSAVHKELKGLLWDDDKLECLSSSKLASTAEEIDDGKENVDLEANQKRWKCEWKGERIDIDGSLKKQLNSHMSKSNGGGAINHSDVLKALSLALRKTEDAYLEAADKRVKENPELALMGSCVLVMLMKGEDVYLMNVGDSRAVLGRKGRPNRGSRKVNQETSCSLEEVDRDQLDRLGSFQLTMDHSTYEEEEVERIKNEHPDDDSAVMNERVKGYLKVTRAFGAGFLKQPKWNDALLEMFRIDYVGTSPYITCTPWLYHHRLGPRDRFLILSSDGLYQYLTNEEAISQVESFIASFPDGDPAQHLIEELLFRAAKKAGLDFHELLAIPQGDRRRYHDDVSIIIISLEGRIWRSSV